MKALNDTLIPYLKGKTDIKIQLMSLLGIGADKAEDILETVIDDLSYDWEHSHGLKAKKGD